MNIWDSWAGMYRNTRAMGAAVAMLIAIVTMQVLRCDPMVSRENVSGVVLLVEVEGLQPYGDGEPQSRVVVITSDSVKVRLLLPPPVPVAGDAIPLLAEHFKKGDTLYSLDRQKWRMDGPR
jgi:hypothetical protein